MPSPKTQPRERTVASYMATIDSAERRKEARSLIALFREVSGAPPVMWGGSIIGFGRHRYPGSGGKSAEWPLLAFSVRAGTYTLYVLIGAPETQSLLSTLGTFKTGKGCLYIRRLSDVHLPTLRRLLKATVRQAKARMVATA